MKLESAEPRSFGVVPPAVALAAGTGALVVGIIVLASGALLAAAIWMAAGVALVALALDDSPRWQASALPQVAAKIGDGVGSRLGPARATAGVWGAASRRVVALRRELRGGIDSRIAAGEREMEEVLSSARQRVHNQKVAVRPTQQFAVADTPPPIGDRDRTRTAPTARRPASPRNA